MKWMMLFLAGLIVVGTNEASAVTERHYTCCRAAGPITVDGKLDEPSWESATRTEPFVNIRGESYPEPRFDTRVLMLWDDAYFYVAADMEEPEVWATLTERDSYIYRDDNDFEVFIDPNGDELEYYELEMNALNTVWDLFLNKPYSEGGHGDDSWDIEGLKTAVHVNGTLNDPGDMDVGWSVEIAFPWEVLAEYAHKAAPPNHGDEWRVQFCRVEYYADVVDGKYQRRGDTRQDWVWAPHGEWRIHNPEKWSYVYFSTDEMDVVSVEEISGATALPSGYSLSQNVPNPFNAQTTIRYDLPEAGQARLYLYNPCGQRIRTLAEGQRSAGAYSVVWDGRDGVGRNVASGVYLIRLEVEGECVQIRRMVLLR